MKDILISTLRDKKTKPGSYRQATEKLGNILAYEASLLLQRDVIEIPTPIAKAQGSKLAHNVALVPILRSGLALLPSFLHYFYEAKVGFIGIRRDEVTAIPKKYYQNLPAISQDDDILILEPMIATGGSLEVALDLLKALGLKEEKIIICSIIAAPEGLGHIQKIAPKARLVVAQKDESLNAAKFIVPGLGDFGDRYFRTEKHLDSSP